MNPQRMLDREARLLSVLGVVTAPVLTLLVGHNVLSAQDATAIGSIVAALLVGFHGHGALQNRKNNAP
jgi:uncharacterized membrane protein